MTDFIGLFVIIEKGTGKIAYTSHELTGDGYPTNTLDDILALVLLMNLTNQDDTVTYVDMTGIMINGEMNYWEVAE